MKLMKVWAFRSTQSGLLNDRRNTELLTEETDY